MGFYFDNFEHRQPPQSIKYNPYIEMLWQFCAIIALVLGANYIRWRWMESLNYNALWFAIPLVIAETCAYIGLILFTINLWKTRDEPQQLPPQHIGDCLDDDTIDANSNRPISIDLFIATYNEDPELVRLSIKDALKVTYPHPIDYKIYVLDDGRREVMKKIAADEGVNYITRAANTGFKAGNLRNGMEHTHGDFIIICDADTRVFPTIIEHTLGYFRDPDVAWVQTPQWFFDLPEGKPLPQHLNRYLGRLGYHTGRLIEKLFGPITIGKDPFVNDPKMFYDVILRRRNWANAVFCCGAASIHRREAIMQSALRSYAREIEREILRYTVEIKDDASKNDMQDAMRTQLALETELTPYKFHVSEDIYTSIILHSDASKNWRSIMHPHVESKMLSPQDLLTWVIQRFKYAAGSLDILFHDNPLFNNQNGQLTFSQRAMYMATFWSYLGGIWNSVFLFAPIVYLFTNISPVSAYSVPFYWHFIPFIIMTELAFMFGSWGIAGWDGKSSYLSFFPINLKAIDTVLRGEQIKFHVTPKIRQQGVFFHLIKPQISVIVLTVLGLIWGGFQLFTGKITDPSGYIINIFWGMNNIAVMLPILLAAMWKPETVV